MIYLNYLQAKLRPAVDNCKDPVIVNNILFLCNTPSRKKWNLDTFASHPVSAAKIILLGPPKYHFSKIHNLNPQISGDPPQTILPSPVCTPNE